METKNNSSEDVLNEGLFGMIGAGLKKLFDKGKEWANKVKGVKEVNVIFDKHLKEVMADIKKGTGIDLTLAEPGSEKDTAATGDNKTAPETGAPKTGAPDATKEPIKPGEKSTKEEKPAEMPKQGQFTGEGYVFEELIQTQDDDDDDEGQDDAGAGGGAGFDTTKYNAMLGIINKRIEIMGKEMDKVLLSKGGAGKNPELAAYIGIEKLKFDLAFKEAVAKACEASKDPKAKELLKKVTQDIQVEQKKLDQKMDMKNAKNITIGDQTFTIGKVYRYKNGEERPVKIIGEITDPKKGDPKLKLYGQWAYGNNSDMEQPFTAKDFDDKFKPEVGKKYMYHSKKTNKDIPVTVKEIDDKNKTVKVETKKGKTFVKGFGRLQKEAGAEEEKGQPQSRSDRDPEKEAVLLVGHGTGHPADSLYSLMAQILKRDYKN
ncbi:hypothetical protein HGB13_05290, partial [bacterium]|nr:hypothetical protein [bacterium]